MRVCVSRFHVYKNKTTAAHRIQTLKFDELCYNFYEHEYLDQSEAVITVSKNEAGLITGLTMANALANGAPVPFTVKTADAQQVRLKP